MLEVKVNEQISFDPPLGSSDGIRVTHEWGKTVDIVGYDWTPDSIGVHKIVFMYQGEVVTAPIFRAVYLPLITYEEFNDNTIDESLFDEFESLIRHTVQNYCGQKFGPYVGQTIEIQGDGGDALELPAPALALTSVEDSFGTDLTQFVDIAPGANGFLLRKAIYGVTNFFDAKADITFRMSDLFKETQSYVVTGDFGWEYVPQEVQLAANILIKDVMSEASEMIQQGIVEQHLGDFKIKYNADRWGSTGNGRADNLLAGYVNFGIGLI